MSKAIFIGWDQDYELDAIQSIKSKNSSIVYVNRKLASFLFRYAGMVYRVYVKTLLSKCGDSDVLIVPDSKVIVDLIADKKNKKVIIFRNKIDGHTCAFLTVPRASFYSFDQDDCNKYGISYLRQFVSIPPMENTKVIYDFIFLGAEKNRGDYLLKLKDILENYGYKCLFDIKTKPICWSNKIIMRLPFNSRYKRVSYRDYIKNVMRSRVIVDIVNEGQRGFTLRVLEAALLQKKLITNNESIIKSDIYKKDNVFVIKNDFEELTKNRLDAFLKKDVLSIDDKVLKRYQGETVLGELLKSELS